MQNPLILAAILLVAAPAFLSGQSYRGTVNEGNELYRQKKYDAAREKYERAATVEAERPESYFNSGNTAYRSDDIKAALEEYEKAGLRFRDKQRISQTLYNAGNTFLNAAEKGAENPMLQAAGEKTEDLRMEGYRQAIEMYKKALKLNPGDDDARYNLTYARKKLEDLQKQQQNQDQNKDQNKDKQQQKQKEKDKEQDQQNQEKNKQEEQQKKDQQDKDQQKQQNQKGENEQDKAKQEQQKQPQPDKDQQMSKQQAEQILRALQREEKDLQKKKRQEQGRRVDVEKDW